MLRSVCETPKDTRNQLHCKHMRVYFIQAQAQVTTFLWKKERNVVGRFRGTVFLKAKPQAGNFEALVYFRHQGHNGSGLAIWRIFDCKQCLECPVREGG